jgi:hypothetical protein
MHIVEIRRDVGDVAEPIGRMRNWLDEHRIAPQLFGRLIAVSDAPAA